MSNRAPRFARRGGVVLRPAFEPGSASPKASGSSLPRGAERRPASPLSPVESDRLPPDFELPPDRSTDSDPQAGPLAHQRSHAGPILGQLSVRRQPSRMSRAGSRKRSMCCRRRANFARWAGDLRDLLSTRRRASREPTERSASGPTECCPPQACSALSGRAAGRPTLAVLGQRDGLRPRGLPHLAADLNWNESRLALDCVPNSLRPPPFRFARAPRLWRADTVPCILPQSNRPARGRVT